MRNPPTRADLAVPRLPHRAYDRAQLLLFAGRRGQGKTTALKRYLEEREPRVFALDPFEDLGNIRRRLDPREAMDELAEGGACRRRVVPPIGAGSLEYASAVFRYLIDHEIGDLLLVLDELTLWSKPTGSSELQTLVLQGRRLGIRIAAAIQRISLAPSVMLSEVTEFVLFNHVRPRDLEVIADWTDTETAESVRKLRVGECLVFLP